jgi:hypothetical protein
VHEQTDWETCEPRFPAFIQVSSEVHLSDAVWILFSNFQEADTESLEEFFHDMYIPLDCEFLVAHAQDPDVIISEVFRVTRNTPLTRNYFGVWRQRTGIALTNISFFERRNDLQGTVMNVATMTVSVCRRGGKAPHIPHLVFKPMWRLWYLSTNVGDTRSCCRWSGCQSDNLSIVRVSLFGVSSPEYRCWFCSLRLGIGHATERQGKLN